MSCAQHANARSLFASPDPKDFCYGSFIDLAYEPAWMAYALAPLSTMLIPEPDELPTPSATDPLALSSIRPAAAESPPPVIVAVTAAKPRDPNASATRDDYEEAQTAARAAAETPRAAAKPAEADKAKKKVENDEKVGHTLKSPRRSRLRPPKYDARRREPCVWWSSHPNRPRRPPYQRRLHA